MSQVVGRLNGMLRGASVLAVAAILSSCSSGSVLYTPPSPRPIGPNIAFVARSRDSVWHALVPELARTFFVINNLDQGSGFVNVSYSGDPEQFVDCGRLVSRVGDINSNRSYEFPAARARVELEVFRSGSIHHTVRTMQLEGRANIVLEAISPDSTRVSVSVHYELTRTVTSVEVGEYSPPQVSVGSFNSDGMTAFTGTAGDVTCRPNGALETRLLAMTGQH